MTVRARLFDARGEDRELDLAVDSIPKVTGDRLLWVDLDSRDPADLESVAAALELEPQIVGRLRFQEHRSRILRLTERTVLTLGAVDPNDVAAARRELDVVVGRNLVVTVHDGALAAVDEYRDEMSHDEALGQLDAWAFTGGLIDSVLAIYLRQVEAVERDVDKLDQLALTARAPGEFLDAVVVLRGRIARLRRALVPNREALSPLARPDFELADDSGRIWPGIIERLERAIDSIENARELLVGSFDIHLGQTAQRANEVMKVLTIVSALALPAIVLAGVMGMNFALDFFDTPSNFWLVIGAMLVFSIVLVVVARWRRWL